MGRPPEPVERRQFEAGRANQPDQLRQRLEGHRRRVVQQHHVAGARRIGREPVDQLPRVVAVDVAGVDVPQGDGQSRGPQPKRLGRPTPCRAVDGTTVKSVAELGCPASHASAALRRAAATRWSGSAPNATTSDGRPDARRRRCGAGCPAAALARSPRTKNVARTSSPFSTSRSRGVTPSCGPSSKVRHTAPELELPEATSQRFGTDPKRAVRTAWRHAVGPDQRGRAQAPIGGARRDLCGDATVQDRVEAGLKGRLGRHAGGPDRVPCRVAPTPSARAAASSSARPGGTRRSQASSAISGIDPTLLATNGVPQAIDSSRTFGTPSERLGRTVTSAARYQSGRSSWWTLPSQRTNESMPSCPDSARRLRGVGPVTGDAQDQRRVLFAQHRDGAEQRVDALDRNQPADPQQHRRGRGEGRGAAGPRRGLPARSERRPPVASHWSPARRARPSKRPGRAGSRRSSRRRPRLAARPRRDRRRRGSLVSSRTSDPPTMSATGTPSRRAKRRATSPSGCAQYDSTTSGRSPLGVLQQPAPNAPPHPGAAAVQGDPRRKIETRIARGVGFGGWRRAADCRARSASVQAIGHTTCTR